MSGLGLEGITELDLINLAAVLGVIWKVIILPYIQVRYGVMIPKKKKKTMDTAIKKPGNPGNPGPRPGDADTCKENRDMIIRVETKIETIEKQIENIFRKLDKM